MRLINRTEVEVEEMNLRKNLKTIPSLLITLSALLAFTTQANAAVAQKKAEEKKEESPLSIFLTVSYNGGPISYVNSLRQANGDGSYGDPVSLTPSLELDYKVGDSPYSVFIRPSANWQHVIDQQFAMNDLEIGVLPLSVVSAGNFSMVADMTASIPMSTGSLDNHLLFAPGSAQSYSYKLGKSAFSLATWTSVKTYFYYGPGAGNQLSLRLSPGLKYSMSEKVVGGTKYNLLSYVNSREDALFSKLKAGSPSLVTYLVWMASDRITASVAAVFYTGEGLNADASSFAFDLTAKLF